MKKTFFYTLIVSIAFALMSCGGPDAKMNKEYGISPNKDTKTAIEMVKKMMSKDMPGGKILKYTDAVDSESEGTPYHYIIATVKNNGSTENITFYFNEDYSNISKNAMYILHPDMYGLE